MKRGTRCCKLSTNHKVISLEMVAKQTFTGRASALRTVCLSMLVFLRVWSDVDHLLRAHSILAPQLMLFRGDCRNWGVATASRYLGSGFGS